MYRLKRTTSPVLRVVTPENRTHQRRNMMLFLRITVAVCCLAGGAKAWAVPLEEDRVYSSPQRYNYVGTIDVYCWRPEPGLKNYLELFKTASLDFTVLPEDLQLFGEENEQAVQQKYLDSASGFSLLASKIERKVNLRHRCVGIASKKTYEFTFTRDANSRRFVLFCIGVATFFSAPVVCRSAAVFYVCGTGVGVLAFLLIAVFLASRLLPRRAAGYALIAFGWTIVLSWLESLWSNAQHVLVNHGHLVVCYLLGSAAISFAVCYRFGPPSNPRTLDLIQWTLQLAGLSCVYCSSDQTGVMTAAIVMMLSIYTLPSFLRMFSPPKAASPLCVDTANTVNASTPDVEGIAMVHTPTSRTYSDDDGTWTIVTKIRSPGAKNVSVYIRSDEDGSQNGCRTPRKRLAVTERQISESSSDDQDHSYWEAYQEVEDIQ